MSIYTSQGTIRIRCDTGASGGGDRKTTIYFLPEKDYSIKHRNKNYAVFVPQSCGCSGQSCGCSGQSCGCSEQSCGCSGQSCGCSEQSCKNAIIRKYNPDEGKEIEIHAAGIDCMDVISIAAVNRVKVQVEVKATLKKDKILEAAKEAAEAAKEAAEAAKKDTEAAKKKDQAVKKLMKVANESRQCLRLVGITIPAQ